MKKNVNFVLIGLIVGLMLSMVGLSVYYRNTYTQLKDEYTCALGDIQNTSVELNNTLTEVQLKNEELQQIERELLDYINELNLSKERESSLGEHFTELEGEKEILEDDLVKTTQERNEYRGNYTVTKRNLDVCSRDLEVTETELSYKKSQVASQAKDILLTNASVEEIHDYVDEIYVDETETSDLRKVDNRLSDIDDATNSLKGRLSDPEDLAYITEIEDQLDELEELLESIRETIALINEEIDTIAEIND